MKRYLSLSGICLLLAVCFVFLQCKEESALPAVADTVLTQEDSYFYVDVAAYPTQRATLPIGMFDSGTGGLTVLDAVLKSDQFDNFTHQARIGGDGLPDFKREYFIYLGDQANMPYGNYPLENNTALLREHIIKDVQFLLDHKYYRYPTDTAYQTDKSPVKAIVIACNTATAYGQQLITTFLKRAGINLKVIGVIDAGVCGALDYINPQENVSIGIMATAGTIASGGYVRAMRQQLQERSYSGRIKVFQQAGIGLAGAIDDALEYIAPGSYQVRDSYQGPSLNHTQAPIDTTILDRYGFDWQDNHILVSGDQEHPEQIQLNSVENYIRYHLVSLLEQIRQTPLAHPLKAIILGCTHYPFYSEQFQRILQELYHYQEAGRYVYRSIMKPEIILIDPAHYTAVELYQYLAMTNLFARADPDQSEFYISRPNLLNADLELDGMGNFTYAYKYGRQAGNIQQYVKRVPFSRLSLSEDSRTRLAEKIPFVYELICDFNARNPKTEYLPADQLIE